jgi:glycosyltransferase involved in cell wall biosynthesis
MNNFIENNLPFVSIIIPCRNEEKFISKCLDSINGNDYPKDKLEILVVDGMSEDGTRQIVEEYVQKHTFLQLLNNPKKVVSPALNIGIKEAKSDIVMRMDAHCIYDKDYISKCVEYLQRHEDVDNVGGICITLPGNNTLLAQSIALALSHPFGVGNSYFRIGSKKEKYVDSVPFGCYRKKTFFKNGFFDEDLVRGQDAEFNARLMKNGGKIFLVPEIISYYYARDSLGKLWKMHLQYGYFKPLLVKKIGKIFTLRQLIPPLFVGSLIVSLILAIIFRPFLWFFIFISGSYIITDLGFSLKISLNKGLKYFFALPLVFATLHFSYGAGYLKGVWDFIIVKKDKKREIKDMPLTR